MLYHDISLVHLHLYTVESVSASMSAQEMYFRKTPGAKLCWSAAILVLTTTDGIQGWEMLALQLYPSWSCRSAPAGSAGLALNGNVGSTESGNVIFSTVPCHFLSKWIVPWLFMIMIGVKFTKMTSSKNCWWCHFQPKLCSASLLKSCHVSSDRGWDTSKSAWGNGAEMDVPRARALRKRGDNSQDLQCTAVFQIISVSVSIALFWKLFLLSSFAPSASLHFAQRLIDFKALKSGVAGVISKVTAMATSLGFEEEGRFDTFWHFFSCILLHPSMFRPINKVAWVVWMNLRVTCTC